MYQQAWWGLYAAAILETDNIAERLSQHEQISVEERVALNVAECAGSLEEGTHTTFTIKFSCVSSFSLLAVVSRFGHELVGVTTLFIVLSNVCGLEQTRQIGA
jgi:hypothetical protein